MFDNFIIDFKDIWENFFKKFYKYWLVVLFIILLILVKSYRNYHFKTNNITGKIEKAIYVGSGVVINEHNVLASKELIDEKCKGEYTGLMGKIFVVTENMTIPVMIIAKNDILNTYILATRRNEDVFKYYAIFSSFHNYKEKEKVIIPETLNERATFDFRTGKILKISDLSSLFSIKHLYNEKSLLGSPVFDSKFLLLGNVKKIENNSEYLNKKDKILNKSSVQKTYAINNDEQLKIFLDKNRIKYFILGTDYNLKNTKYHIEDSVVNIICLERY